MRRVLILVALLLASCGPAASQTASPAPSVTSSPTEAAATSQGLTPTDTATPAATATLPAPTIEFASPTPEYAGTPGGIIEVTPLGPLPHEGWFTPRGVMNVRLCPAVTCAIVGQLGAGIEVRFYDVAKTPDGDLWLCRDPAIPCQTFVAWIVGSVTFGDVRYSQ